MLSHRFLFHLPHLLTSVRGFESLKRLDGRSDPEHRRKGEKALRVHCGDLGLIIYGDEAAIALGRGWIVLANGIIGGALLAAVAAS